MNVDFKNDLQNNKMITRVTLKWRERVDQKLITLRTKEVVDIVNEKYTAPEGYTLGECLTKTRAVCNDFEKQLEGEWTFVLVPSKVKKARKPATRKTTTRKASTKKKRS